MPWCPSKHPGLQKARLLPQGCDLPAPTLTGPGRAQSQVSAGPELGGWGGLAAPSDNKLCSLSAPSRASGAPRAIPSPTPSAGHQCVPAAPHRRLNNVHKQVSLSNGLLAGRPPTPRLPNAAGQTPQGAHLSHELWPAAAPGVVTHPLTLGLGAGAAPAISGRLGHHLGWEPVTLEPELLHSYSQEDQVTP